MYLPYVAIITDAQKNNLNAVFEAIGWGPNTFIRKVCAVDPNATPETPPTHWLSSNAGATDADVAMLQRLTAGSLPALPEGTYWGVNGVISAEDAINAGDGAVLQVYSAAGVIEPVDHIAGIFAGRGLQYVPEPEI